MQHYQHWRLNKHNVSVSDRILCLVLDTYLPRYLLMYGYICTLYIHM